MKSKLTTYLIYCLICLTVNGLFAQTKDPTLILRKASEACKNLDLIEYTIHYTMGPLTVEATILQQKSAVKDVGFGNAKIIVDGVLKVPSGEQSFKYSYDGEKFKFHELGKGEVKSIEDPDLKGVSRTLGFQYFLPVMHQYSDSNGMDELIKNAEESEYMGEQLVNGNEALQVRVRQTFMNPQTKIETSSTSDWFFDSKTYLPIKFLSKSSSKTAQINNYSKKEPVSFDINKDNAVLEVSITGKEPKTEGLQPVGSVLPDFSLSDIKGNQLSLDKIEGEVFIIDFWGTWCAPCLQAMPELQALYNEYKDDGLTVIGISVRDPIGKAEKYIDSKGYSYKFLVQGDHYAKELGINTYPTIFILDKNGRILHTEKGKRDGAMIEFEALIKKELKLK